MSDQFLGEIRVFPYNFAPYNWMFCNGGILPISQYTALFSLLGTNFGGNGTTNFKVPDFQGNVPMHPGTSQSGTSRTVGETGGSSTCTLTTLNMPSHTHTLATDGIDQSDQNLPSDKRIMAQSAKANAYQTSNTKLAASSPKAFTPFAGGGGSHNNLQPFLALNFCIALSGIYPQRP